MTQSRQEDYRLYLEYSQGDPEAGMILAEKSYALVYGHARKLTRNSILNSQDVEDIVSQSVVVAFSKSSTYAGKSLFSTWMCGIINNKTREMYRKKQVLQKRECEWSDTPCRSNPLDIIIKKELGQAAIRAYESLSYNLKESVFLINLLGKTEEEAALELRISENDFKARHAYAVKTMRSNFMRIYYGNCRRYVL